jgi:hypothetical protein
VFITGRRQSELDREVHLNSINNVSSAQFLLHARKQHYRIMKTQPISFLSGLILAIAVPVILNAAGLSSEEAGRRQAAALRATVEQGVERLEKVLAQSRRIAWLSIGASSIAIAAAGTMLLVKLMEH